MLKLDRGFRNAGDCLTTARERTRAALAAKKSNGQRVGTVPYGFNLGNDGATLVPNESEQSIVRDIRAMASGPQQCIQARCYDYATKPVNRGEAP